VKKGKTRVTFFTRKIGSLLYVPDVCILHRLPKDGSAHIKLLQKAERTTLHDDKTDQDICRVFAVVPPAVKDPCTMLQFNDLESAILPKKYPVNI
jgi:hypothetical protein